MTLRIGPALAAGLACAGLTLGPAVRAASAQTTPPPTPEPQQHDHAAMGAGGWQIMQDGVLFATFNRQGGERGKKEFRSQNWWMGMASRQLGAGELRLSGMVSLDPLTVGLAGYSQLFQSGEAYKGLSNVDRQHPHDFLMQLSASWRWRLGEGAGITFAGAPVGEAALGPVAFMHRASAAENPTAPLSHHTFDATHITMGVVTVAADLGPFAVETSRYQGREPDEDRWDLMDPGPLDSWSVRLSFNRGSWSAQVSRGFLKEPERLERIDLRRTTGSISWTHQRGDDYTAFAFIAGRNKRTYDHLDAYLFEGTHRQGRTSIYTRIERVTLESEKLLFPLVVHIHHPDELVDPVIASTIGGVRDFARVRGFDFGVGGDVTFHRVPRRLQFTHGENPVSFHIFFRLRPPASLGRMFNTTMTSPMGHAR